MTSITYYDVTRIITFYILKFNMSLSISIFKALYGTLIFFWGGDAHIPFDKLSV